MNVSLVLLPYATNLFPSLGIAYLKNSLIKENHTVNSHEFNLDAINNKLIKQIKFLEKDFVLLVLLMKFNSELKKNIFLDDSINYYANSILEKNPSLVGFSVMRRNSYFSLLVSKKLKELNPNLIIVFGGPDTLKSNFNNFALDSKYVDFIIQGEGESNFLNLLEKVKGLNALEINLDKNERLIKSDECLIKDLDDIPFPIFEKKDLLNSEVKEMLPILSSRGCVNNCSYCSERKFWKGYRQRSPENVISEILYQMKEHNIPNFYFFDSLINSNRKFLLNFSNLLLEKKINIKWGGNAIFSKSLDDEIIKTMSSAGCSFLNLGLESGSEDVRKKMNKLFSNDIAINNLKLLCKYNIWVHLYLIVGHPSEKEEDFRKTLLFLKESLNLISSYYVHNYHPTPNETVDDKLSTFRSSIIKSIFYNHPNNVLKTRHFFFKNNQNKVTLLFNEKEYNKYLEIKTNKTKNQNP